MNLTLKGTYYFKVFCNGIPMKMQQSSRNVIANVPVLSSSQVLYYDDNTNNMRIFEKEVAVNEDNKNRLPQFQLILCDQFGNKND